jgi:hypothetical protein
MKHSVLKFFYRAPSLTLLLKCSQEYSYRLRNWPSPFAVEGTPHHCCSSPKSVPVHFRCFYPPLLEAVCYHCCCPRHLISLHHHFSPPSRASSPSLHCCCGSPQLVPVPPPVLLFPSVCASTPPLLSPTPVCSIVTAPLSLCCAVAATTPHCLHRATTTASALISHAGTPPVFTLPSVSARTPLLLLLPLFYACTLPLPTVSAESQLLMFSSVHAAATPLISLPVPQFSCSPQCMLVHHHCCCSLLCIAEQVHHYYCSRHPCSQE